MTTPYLFIPAAAPVPRHVHRVVVGNDGSDLAEAVLRTAQAVGHSLNVDVIAVEAIEPGTINGEAFRRLEPTITARLVRAPDRRAAAATRDRTCPRSAYRTAGPARAEC